MTPFSSALLAARAARRAGGPPNYLLLLDGSAFAQLGDRFLGAGGLLHRRIEIVEAGYAPGPVESLTPTAPMMLAAVIHRLCQGPTSMADLMALSGRSEPEIPTWLSTDFPAAGWSVQTHPRCVVDPTQTPQSYSIDTSGTVGPNPPAPPEIIPGASGLT